MSEWRVVYWFAFVLYMANAVVFTIWERGEVQPWRIRIHRRNSESKRRMLEIIATLWT